MVCSSRWVILSLDDQTGYSLKKDDAPSCRSTIWNGSERFSKQIKKKMIVIYRQLTDRFHMSSWSHSAPKVGKTIQFGRLGSGSNHIQPTPPSTCRFENIKAETLNNVINTPAKVLMT